MLLSRHGMCCFCFHSWLIFSGVMLSQPCEMNFLYSGKLVSLLTRTFATIALLNDP
jgi:hypothetical protein